MTGQPASFNPPIGDPPSIELIPPARLRIDDSYQRATATQSSQTLINRIARDWDWRLCVPLLVSRRADGLFVIDGQHRWLGATKRGDISYLPCCVSEYGSPADEAAIFVAANRKRRAVGVVDTFRAAVLAGDASAAAIQQLLDAAGLRLSRSSSTNHLQPGELNCVTALHRALDRHGVDRLGASLTAIATAFADKPIAHAAPLLQAVTLIIERRGLVIVSALTATLRRRSARDWHEEAARDPAFGASGQNASLATKRVLEAALDGELPIAEPPRPADQPTSRPADQPTSRPADQPTSRGRQARVRGRSRSSWRPFATVLGWSRSNLCASPTPP